MDQFVEIVLCFDGLPPVPEIAAALDEAAAVNWDHAPFATDIDPITGEIWEGADRAAPGAMQAKLKAGEWRSPRRDHWPAGYELPRQRPLGIYPGGEYLWLGDDVPGSPLPSPYWHPFSPFTMQGGHVSLSRWRSGDPWGSFCLRIDTRAMHRPQVTLVNAETPDPYRPDDPYAVGSGRRYTPFWDWLAVCEVLQRVRRAVAAAGGRETSLRMVPAVDMVGDYTEQNWAEKTFDLTRVGPEARPLEMAWRLIPEAEWMYRGDLLRQWLTAEHVDGPHGSERDQIYTARARLYAEASAWTGRPQAPPRW